MIKRYAPTAARILLGLIFLGFGVNGFLHFLPMPPLEEPAKAFGGALIATGYMVTLIKVNEIVDAGMLLTGRFVPICLTLLSPIVVNIAAF
ncbi:MAG: DoxX family protein, partial [Polyangiaceae bacterium]|nr:DoxX family protein [Polyangiaceae bacterium]